MISIKLFAMDVDGTMTDGKIYIGNSGEVFKAFSVKDGQGIKLLQDADIVTAIITSRYSDIVKKRAEELSIQEIYQGENSKVEVLTMLCRKYSISPQQIAYIGDDLGDLQAIRFSGQSFCPSDAVNEIKSAVTCVLNAKGGEGAVREAATIILTALKG